MEKTNSASQHFKLLKRQVKMILPRNKLSKILMFLCFLFILTVNLIQLLINKNENKQITQRVLSLRMNERRNKIRYFCSEHPKNDTYQSLKVKHVLRKFFIDPKNHISWCPVYKAASTTWMKKFAQLGDILNPKVLNFIDKGIIQWNTLSRKAFPIDSDTNTTLNKLKQTKRFIIVRHPFERILSAYRDKIEHKTGRNFYFRRYSSYIINNFRKEWLNKEEPTFEEFLTFIVKNMMFDEHWIPISLQCLPCLIRYDFIIKLESFKVESDYMINILGLRKKLSSLPEENINHDSKTTFKVAKLYYSSISRGLLQKVYNLYKDDFEMFGYSPEEYFNVTRRDFIEPEPK